MAHDGLPLAYTSEEIYDKVGVLRGILKMEKTALVELGVFFTYMRKMMNSLAETTFLVGAECASLQAASRLASAEQEVKEELGKAERAEQELLVLETENVVKVGKEEKQLVKLGTEFVKEEIKKFATVHLPDSNEMKVTVFENEVAKEDDESPSFERNGDELMMISAWKNDDDGNIKITNKKADDLKPEDKEEVDINSNPDLIKKRPKESKYTVMSCESKVESDEINLVQLDGNDDSDEEVRRYLDQAKSVLNKLLSNILDKFEVLNISRMWGLELSDDNFSRQKYQLQKTLLEHILKEDDSDYYQRLLKETRDLLNIPKERGYRCSLVGCTFSALGHRNYIRHLSEVHQTMHKFTCNFKNACRINVSTIELLVEHLRHNHSVVRNRRESILPTHIDAVQINCRCNLLSYGEQQFSSVALLMRHINNFHAKEPRSCIFEDCDSKFSENSISRHHFRNKHVNLGKTKLKNKHLMNPELGLSVQDACDDHNKNPGEENLEYDEVNEELYEAEDFVFIENSNLDQTGSEEIGENFLKAYANFINKLGHFKFIPLKTVQSISSEFLEQSLKSMRLREIKLRASLRNANLQENDINAIVEDVLMNDDMLNAQKELNTTYKQKKFVQEHFKYVAPVEIILNKADVLKGAIKDSFHYIPTVDAFKALVEDETFVSVYENERLVSRADRDIVKDVKDGNAYKMNAYFQANPQAYCMLLYSDAVELVNPLSASRGKHKIVQVFFSLAKTPKAQRSQIDRLQLALIVKEKILKKYGYDRVYQTFMEDLKRLENGIKIDKPVPRLVKCGLLLHAADNLEAHEVGGFSTCFSSKSVCRWCHVQYNDLQSNIHDFDGKECHRKWAVDEYDKIADQLERNKEADSVDSEDMVTLDRVEGQEGITAVNLFDEFDEPSSEEDSDSDQELEIESENEDVSTYGLRWRCPFNTLESFHSITSFPPDFLHDILEGIIPQDLFGVIQILFHKGWFSIEDYNKSLSKHCAGSNDKPQEVPKKLSKMKLLGKAVSHWVHIRNFGMVIKSFVKDPSDPALVLGLLLVQLTERLTAEKFRQYEIDIVEESAMEYLDARKLIYEEFPRQMGNAKPKHHNLVHYAEAIRNFGPPLSYWTARYESKHRVAKNTSENAKNFKNISFTLAERQQMRMSSVYFEGMFETEKCKLPEKVSYKEDIPDDTEFQKNLKEFMGLSDLICEEIEIHNQGYKKGELVVIEAIDNHTLKVGIVLSILVKSSRVYFVVKRYEAKRNSLEYFSSEKQLEDVSFIDAERLHDYKPLKMIGTQRKFVFSLHHHISFDNQ